jgi:hypothetical protein
VLTSIATEDRTDRPREAAVWSNSFYIFPDTEVLGVQDDDNVLGPIDFLVVEFPNGRVTSDGFKCLLDLVARDTIRILDVEFVETSTDGVAHAVALEKIDHDAEVDIAGWQAADSRLLDGSDIDAIGAVLAPGSVAGVVVYENVWAIPLITAIDRGGARVIGHARVAAEDVMSSLDTGDPARSQV